jgi:hypothetical protein
MIIAHYAHRLPATYDMAQIRTRAKTLAPDWDDVPELYFKGFLLRERGQHGATANSYSSLYLWRQDEAFRDFVVAGRFKTVTDSFGRPEIQTMVGLDARRGRGKAARFAYKEAFDIPQDADLKLASDMEVERNRDIAGRPGTVASAIGLDTQNWRFTRIILSENAPTADQAGTGYEVLHLATPLLDTLPAGF